MICLRKIIPCLVCQSIVIRVRVNKHFDYQVYVVGTLASFNIRFMAQKYLTAQRVSREVSME